MPARLLVVIVCAANVGFGVRATAEPLNVVVLLSDDQAHDALGCAGNSAIRTPHLDQLAAEGVRFTRCFTPNPICTPSRACIFSGQDSWTNGCVFFGEPIKPSSPRWPQALARAGYETFFTGKWHNVVRPWDAGFTSGASIWIGGNYDHQALPVVPFQGGRADRQAAPQYSSTQFVDQAIRFLGERRTAKPFCLFVSFTVPHDPWIPPAGYENLYRAEDMPLPRNFRPRPPFAIRESFATLRDQRQLPFPRTKADVRTALTKYYAMITHMDEQVGRLIGELKRQQLDQRTAILFLSDHGYSMGSHGFVGKQTMNEEGIRLPFILRHPTLPRGAPSSAALVSLVDLFPTICQLAEVDLPAGVEGKSLLPLYTGKQLEPFRSHVFASFHSPNKHQMSTRCVRGERFKLIQHLLTGEVEFFDLVNDPDELKNLAGDLQHADPQKQLGKLLAEWRNSSPDK